MLNEKLRSRRSVLEGTNQFLVKVLMDGVRCRNKKVRQKTDFKGNCLAGEIQISSSFANLCIVNGFPQHFLVLLRFPW